MLGLVMDRAMLEKHLAMTERHIAEGQNRIEKQRTVIAGLKRDGHPTGAAEDFLATLLDTQELAAQERERLLRELGA